MRAEAPRVIERTEVEACWPHLLEMLQAMDAASDEDAAAIWDDAEAWARSQGHETPKEWAARYDAAYCAALEDLPFTDADFRDGPEASTRRRAWPDHDAPRGVDEVMDR